MLKHMSCLISFDLLSFKYYAELVYIIWFLPSLVGYYACFPFLDIMNNSSINIPIYIFVGT